MLVHTLTEIIIKSVIYMTFFMGVWLLVKPYVKHPVFHIARGIRNGSKSLAFKSGKLAIYLENSNFYRHLDLLLQSTWKFYTENSVVGFLILSTVLFVSTFAVYFRLTHSWVVALISGTFTSSLPYLVLRLVLQFVRTKTSYELGPTVGLLLANYRVCNKNIYFAILKTIKTLESTTLKKSFIVLANHVQNHKNHNDIENAIELFVFKIQTSWAKQLGILLLTALIEGREIERSLSNIVNDMKEGQKILEQEKSNSHETILLGYLPLLAFPMTIWFMTAMSGQFNILQHQFKNPQGLASFTLTLILCISGFLVALFLRKPKNDL